MNATQSTTEDRRQRGLALAALFKIDRDGEKFLVPSQTGNGERYVVDPVAGECTCPDHQDRKIKCKHLFAVEFSITREQGFDGSTTITKTIQVRERVTYKQNWPAYNLAQTQEKHRLQALLHDLCEGLVEPERAPGRKPLPISDMVFAAAYKTYCGVSTRRLMCDLSDACAKGLIGHAPHFNSVLNYLEKPFLTPILTALIIESSRPLRAVETDFAVDSSGFSTSRYVRWFDIKYGKTVEEREWVKVHLITGVKTNVVTAVEILDKHAADSPQLPTLVQTTARTFTVNEVSADKAYCSQANMEAIAAVGGMPYIAFKENATGKVGGLFAKCFHYYCLNKDDFLQHYHKRSNVESTFSMVKAKFGGHLRSKSDTAMINEVLTKILCHNLCCLIQSHFELGIEATFWGESEEPTEVVPIEEHAEEMEDEMVAAWGWV